MRRLLLAAILLLLSPLAIKAQGGNTTVIATIRDPGGNIYSNSQVNISFFDPGTSGKLPLLNGSTFQVTYTGYATNSSGVMPPISLADNGAIASGSGATGTQWIFSICFSDRVTCFTTKITINCAANIPATCTSNTIDISAALQAASAPVSVVTQPASLTSNNAFTGNNTFSPGTTAISNIAGPTTLSGGMTFSTGPVSINSPSNALNNWSITAPGVFSGPTGSNNENFLFTVNTCNPSTEYGALHTQNATDDIAGCINMAPGGFAPVANALAGYCRGNLNASCNGGYFQARCLVANCSGFGANSVAQDVAALTGIGLLGFESDVFLSNTTTTGAGISVNGNFSVQPTNFPGIIVNKPTFNGGTGQFTAGLSIPSGATTGIAVDIGLTQSGAGNNLPSQTVRMSSRDSGGVLRSSTVGVDANGNIQLSPGSSGVTCNAVNCTLNASFLINPTGTALAVPTVGNNIISDTATQTLSAKTLSSPALTTPTIGGGTALNLYKTVTDTPGAITVNTLTCTDRGVALAGSGTGAIIGIAANYALEANLTLSPGQAVAGTIHYRICNFTAANITLNAAATFNLAVIQ